MRWNNWRAGACAGVMAIGWFASPAYAGTTAAEGGAAATLAEAAAALTAGKFTWADADTAQGPVSIVVSIPAQRMFVYRGEQLIAVTAVSTGSQGHETPTGEFTILQKAVTHRSNKYNNAPMPYMQRLTWDGVALHAGHDPGYAASHGCVRLPLAFAKKLYEITAMGARVSVTDDIAPVGPAQGPATYAVEAPGGGDPETAATKLANMQAVASK